jgi:hypothetical protein
MKDEIVTATHRIEILIEDRPKAHTAGLKAQQPHARAQKTAE